MKPRVIAPVVMGGALLSALHGLAGQPQDFYYHADDLHSATALSSAAGDAAERYECGDYGQTLDPASLRPSPPASVNPLLFTGRRYDVESGWYDYRTRRLDPIAGRFTTRDLVGTWEDAENLGSGLAYVGNRPTGWLDPFGTDACQAYKDCIAKKAAARLLYLVCSNAGTGEAACCVRDCLQQYYDTKRCEYREGATVLLTGKVGTDLGPLVHAKCFSQCGLKVAVNAVAREVGEALREARDAALRRFWPPWQPRY